MSRPSCFLPVAGPKGRRPSDVEGGGGAADPGALRRRAERIASPET